MSKATVGDFIVDRLQQWGIDRVFGYSGDGINGVMGALRRHDLFVTEHIGAVGLRHVLAGGHDDPALNTRALASDTFDQRPEVGVKENIAIFGMVDDVDDLFREQPGVDRVANEARAGRAVVGLHVTVVIPGQRGDTVARL